MAIWLHFSFWGLSFDISALFRLSESGGRLLVTNGFHIGRAEFSVVIDMSYKGRSTDLLRCRVSSG